MVDTITMIIMINIMVINTTTNNKMIHNKCNISNNVNNINNEMAMMIISLMRILAAQLLESNLRIESCKLCHLLIDEFKLPVYNKV